MKFTVTHCRAFAGQNISVKVEAEGKETIRWVDVILDAESLDETEFPPEQQSYQRDFSAVGTAGPGTNHILTVSATEWDGKRYASTTQWEDAS